MTTSGGSSGGSSSSGGNNSTKNKVGSVSKGASGVSPGETGYQSLSSDDSKDGSIATGVLQKAAENTVPSRGEKSLDIMAPLTFPSTANSIAPTGSIPEPAPTQDITTPAPIDTTVTPGASDVITALASQVGEAAPRPPAVSNNFTSLASRAGSKRSLIGGA